MDPRKAITHFYHVYADGHWREPVKEHVDALIRYGLADQMLYMYVGFVGTRQNCEEAASYIADRGILVYPLDAEPEGWEQVTMKYIPQLMDAGPVLYAHTKGAYDPSPINIKWRKSMTYHSVVTWERAVNALVDEDYDTAGSHWLTADDGRSFYGGTFWWANPDYIRRLPPLEYDSRWSAEHWIGQASPNKVFDLNPGHPADGRTVFTTEW